VLYRHKKLLSSTVASPVTRQQGAILLQRNGANFNIIHHASHTLNEAQRNYPMVEKKLVDVIFSHDKFRSYVYDALVKVHMDRDGLKEILEKKLMLNLE
jgi:hypothetical protein